MAAEPMPHDLTDEERIATKYVILSGEYDDLTGEQARAKAQELAPLVAAVRAALPPAVTPLAPGETVTIRDSVDPAGELGLSDLEGLDGTHELRIDAQSDSNWATLYLDAAGVAALERACQRWRAAHNETQVVKKSLESAIGAEKA